VRLWPAAAACDVNARFLAPQREPRCFRLQTLAGPDHLGEVFASPTAAFLGPCLVDFVGALGGVRENQYLIAGDLQKSAADGHRFFCAALLDSHHPRVERRQQRRVAWQDTDNALGARRDDHVHRVLGENFPFGGDDLNSQRHRSLLP